jgi:hypothetical protein
MHSFLCAVMMCSNDVYRRHVWSPLLGFRVRLITAFAVLHIFVAISMMEFFCVFRHSTGTEVL